VNVLAIVNPPDNLNTVAQYVAKHKVSYPILFDFGTTAANYMQVTPQNSTVDLPHLFIIDKDGRIVEDFGWVEPGKNPLEAGNLIAVLDKIVAAQGAAPAKPAAAKK
jgi:peroxiredoxin